MLGISSYNMTWARDLFLIQFNSSNLSDLAYIWPKYFHFIMKYKYDGLFCLLNHRSQISNSTFTLITSKRNSVCVFASMFLLQWFEMIAAQMAQWYHRAIQIKCSDFWAAEIFPYYSMHGKYKSMSTNNSFLYRKFQQNFGWKQLDI